MTKLDLTKPLQTKGGDPVAVVAGTDGRLYGYRELAPQHCISEMWSLDGKLVSHLKGQHYEKNGSLCDLVNVPEKRTVKVWLTRRREGGSDAEYWTAYDNEGHARRENAMCGGRNIACIEREITFTVGEGLEP